MLYAALYSDPILKENFSMPNQPNQTKTKKSSIPRKIRIQKPHKRIPHLLTTQPPLPTIIIPTHIRPIQPNPLPLQTLQFRQGQHAPRACEFVRCLQRGGVRGDEDWECHAWDWDGDCDALWGGWGEVGEEG